MKVLLHTIALEPARWLPERVSRPLLDLIPAIAEAGFSLLEVYEPHLSLPNEWNKLSESFQSYRLKPLILSSYLQLDHARLSEPEFHRDLEVMVDCINCFGFQKVRLFPGPPATKVDRETLPAFRARLQQIVAVLPETEILLETHDGSLADNPALLAKLVSELDCPTIGLLYQPTIFEPAIALAQWREQKHLVRHLHLQNRNPDLSFTTLAKGVISWPEIMHELSPSAGVTLEFVPSGICSVQEFDLDACLTEARAEAEYAELLWQQRAS